MEKREEARSPRREQTEACSETSTHPEWFDRVYAEFERDTYDWIKGLADERQHYMRP